MYFFGFGGPYSKKSDKDLISQQKYPANVYLFKVNSRE